MRMYLSSFRLGTDPAHLVRLAGDGARAAVIANAIDGEPPETRQDRVADELRALERLGFRAREVDLRDHFGSTPDRVMNDLAAFEVLWVRGGNVFVLRHALAAAGADAAVTELVRADRVVYAGYSAGLCVLAPSLEGLETVDDAGAVRRAHAAEATFTGLGLLENRVVPHVQSPTHVESAALDRLAEHYERTGVPHLRLRDGQALVVEGDRQQLVGRSATVAELMTGPTAGAAPLVLRPMTPADLDPVLALQREGAQTGLGHIFPQDEFPFRTDAVRDRWARELADDDIDCFVVLDEHGTAAGFAATRSNEFLHFGTALDSWGSGLAGRAHDEVLAHLAGRGHEQAWLRVFDGNLRARRFYERRGWRPTGERTTSGYPPCPVLLTYEMGLSGATEATSDL